MAIRRLESSTETSDHENCAHTLPSTSTFNSTSPVFGASTCYTPTEQSVPHFTGEKSITPPHLVPEAPGIIQFPDLSPGFLGSQSFQTIFKDLNFRLKLHRQHLKPAHLPFASHVITESCSKSLFQTYF